MIALLRREAWHINSGSGEIDAPELNEGFIELKDGEDEMKETIHDAAREFKSVDWASEVICASRSAVRGVALAHCARPSEASRSSSARGCVQC
jgi:hypothetical protein